MGKQLSRISDGSGERASHVPLADVKVTHVMCLSGTPVICLLFTLGLFVHMPASG